MASSTIQLVVRVNITQPFLGDRPKIHFLTVCENCGKDVSESTLIEDYDRTAVPDLHNVMITHLIQECSALPECKKPECRYVRHLGECFHDGGTR